MQSHASHRKLDRFRPLTFVLAAAAVFMAAQPLAASRPARRRSSVDLRAVPLPAHKNPYREYPDCDPERNSCLKVLVTLIERAKAQSPIVVFGYDFSDDEVSAALGDALDRHVNVGIVVSGMAVTARRTVLELLREHGADVFIDHCAGMPGPTVVIDNFVVVTGRFHDRDESGTQPRPAMELLHNSTIAMVYVNEWVKHYRHSLPGPALRNTH